MRITEYDEVNDGVDEKSSLVPTHIFQKHLNVKIIRVL